MKNVLSFFALGLLVLALIVFLAVPQVFAPVIGQTFPPVAVLALAVPMIGFGEKPTLIALFLYAL